MDRFNILDKARMGADNTVIQYLENGGSRDQTVLGTLGTPITFDYTVPVGKNLELGRMLLYMEGATNFDSTLFGDLAELVNGWIIQAEGIELITWKNNREIATTMFDARGEAIFGKVNRTMVGRFSVNRFSGGTEALTVPSGTTFASIVQDDLSTLTFLEVAIEGVLRDV